MTGFGQAEGTVGTSRVLVEVRTVNHRFFSPSIKLPGAYGRWETEVREAMRLKVSRGHVSAPREDEDTGTVADLVALVDCALDHLGRARADEGARLATVLRERLAMVDSALQRIALRAPERLLAQRDRLRAAVRELADGLAVDEGRLAQEIAILADRMDVSEELDRFRSHITAFHGVLSDTSGEPVGKRLGFLLQEMLREANTTGSKAADAAILHDVVGVKEELERIREQVENLE